MKKIFFQSWFLLVLSVSLMICSMPLVVYADVSDQLPGWDFVDVESGSNAMVDYSVMPMSSLGTVTNTIDSSAKIRFDVYYYPTGSENLASKVYYLSCVNGRWPFSISVDGVISQFNVALYRSDGSLPLAGTYSFSYDLSSDFSYDYRSFSLAAYQRVDNVASTQTSFTLDFQQYSGDVYLSPTVITLGSLHNLYIRHLIPVSQNVSQIGGSLALRFVASSADTEYAYGSDTSTSDYQSSVSSSISNISSSLESVDESLQYISSSQNLIIQGIDNVIMHISDQLYAFWDQLYNLIHEPQMAKMDEIIDAIENIDLEVNVNLDKLKSSIDTMNTDIQNKLQSTTDKITSGYDSSGLDAENSELSGAVTEYDQAEQEVMDSVTGNIDSFEYPDVETMPGGILAALFFFGGFMQSCFANMGDFNIVITLSLTMIFVLILVGYHRIRT